MPRRAGRDHEGLEAALDVLAHEAGGLLAAEAGVVPAGPARPGALGRLDEGRDVESLGEAAPAADVNGRFLVHAGLS